MWIPNNQEFAGPHLLAYTARHMRARESAGESWQLQHIGEIEKRLWTGADTLRANSNFASNEYFLPVMGLIFLRHAYSRYLRVKSEIEATVPSRQGKKRELTKEDFSQKGAIFLRDMHSSTTWSGFPIPLIAQRPSSRR